MQRTMWFHLTAKLTVGLIFLAGCVSGSGKTEKIRADGEKKDYDAGYREAYRYGV